MRKVALVGAGVSRFGVRKATYRDLIWEAIYAPIQRGVSNAGERLNHLQFLTIRRYLSLVFGALVLLLLTLALWP